VVVVDLTEPLSGESFVYGSLHLGEPVTITQPGQFSIEAGAAIAVSPTPSATCSPAKTGAPAAISQHRRPSLMVGDA
jgi:hypothetical protein